MSEEIRELILDGAYVSCLREKFKVYAKKKHENQILVIQSTLYGYSKHPWLL